MIAGLRAGLILLGITLLGCSGGDDLGVSRSKGGDSGADVGTGNDGGLTPSDSGVEGSVADAAGDVESDANVSVDSSIDSGTAVDASDEDATADADASDGEVEASVPCTNASSCPVGTACDTTSGACTTSCSASSPCNGVCCDGSVCQPGVSANACGLAGVMCEDCTASAQGHVCLPTGSCGCTTPVDCSGAATCVSDTCSPCPGGESVCSNHCVNLENDPANCGVCAKACPGTVGAGCSSGVCNPTCDDALENGTESDVDCGGSCATCGIGQSCGGATDCDSNKCAAGKCDCVELGLPGPPLWFTAPEQPVSIATGDFDGDGHRDFAVVSWGPQGRLSVHLQKNGTFADRTEYVAGGHPRGIAASDLDGDGDMDLVVGSESLGGIVSVLLNAGGGLFAPAVGYTACLNPGSIAISDVNVDGEPDLAVACRSGSAIAVFINQGGGSFAPKVSYPAYGAASIAAGDMDGDGKPDLVVANEDDFADVFHNNGDGTFAPRVSHPCGNKPAAVALGDVDQDGDLDTVLTVTNDYGISVLLNDGTGALGAFKNYTAFVMSFSPTSLALDDVDGDGALDAVFATSNGVGIAGVYRNLGAGTFAIDQAFDVPGKGTSVALADMNGDGKQDLLVGITPQHDFENTAVNLFLNDGANGFLAAPNFSLSGGWSTAITMGDLDGNGKPDMAAVSTVTNYPIRVFYNQGTSFTTKDFDACTMLSLDSADFDGDGKDDLVGACSGYSIAVFLSKPGNTLAKTFYQTGEPGSYVDPLFVDTGDMNGDQKPDIVVANYHGATFSVLLNQGNGTFGAHMDHPTDVLPGDIAVGDVDGDGANDVVVAQRNLDLVSIYYNEGANTFTRIDQPTGPDPISVAIGDLNGDGKRDLAVVNGSFSGYDNGTTSVLLNQGNRLFASKVDWKVGVRPSAVELSDLNIDGKLDIAVINNYGHTVSILTNLGANTFQHRAWIAGESPTALGIEDLDANGKPDIAIVDADGYLTMLPNQCW